MAYRVKQPMGLRSAPSLDAERIVSVRFTTTVEILEELPGGEWARVQIRHNGEDLVGFLLLKILEKAPAQEIPEKIDSIRFMDQLQTTAREFSTNYFYLGALAWIESGISNVVNVTSGAAGPFQFLPSTWNGMVKKYGDIYGIDENDIRMVYAQILFAALYARDSAAVLYDALNRLPDAEELYLAHLLGEPAAAAVLTGDRTATIDKPLLQLYASRADAASFVDKIVKGNATILASSGHALAVADVLKNIEAKYKKALKKIAVPIAELVGSPAEFKSNQKSPPWLDQAKSQLGVTEDKSPGGSNPEIEKYHASTKYEKPHPDDVAWCASFVSWCMASSNVPAIVRANIGSPRAADWRGWGQSVNFPPLGAVAVLKPLAQGSSGHVGFVTGIGTSKVTLLAGNQGTPESVCEIDFPLQDVVQFRWLALT